MDILKSYWDILFFSALTLIHIYGWISMREHLKADPQDNLEQRQFSANTLNNACVSGVTAVSILIPATMIVLQLAIDQEFKTTTFLFRASIWFLASLSFGIFVLFAIPMRSQKYNVARILIIGIPFGIQLLSLLIGLIWFVSSIYITIYK